MMDIVKEVLLIPAYAMYEITDSRTWLPNSCQVLPPMNAQCGHSGWPRKGTLVCKRVLKVRVFYYITG